MTPTQCRMARTALRWSTSALAEAADINPTTVNNFENGKESYASTAVKLKAALESSGEITFNGDQCVCFEDTLDKEAGK